jgi:gamma-glutamyl hydrolase
VLSALIFVVIVFGQNQTPVIGILGVPTSEGCVTQVELTKLLPKLERDGISAEGSSCFTSYYVKWIEGAGGRVVPIRYDYTKEELALLVAQLNGLLFTGGGLDLALNSPYVQTANYIFDLAQNQSDYFPIWGTCQGFQLLHILAAQNEAVLLSGFDSEDISWPLQYTSDTSTSRLFSSLPKDIYTILSTENVTMNFHVDGVTPDIYQQYPALPNFFKILSVNNDRKGRQFISTVEALKWPIYASQWHPERPQYEFNSDDVGLVHTYDAIRANQAAAEFFVNECKKSSHQFSNATQLEKMLIYNYNPYYTGQSNQNYVF